MTIDGGSLFPTTPAHYGYHADASGPGYPCGPGASLRIFFAAHAPTEIPDWFQPTMKTVAEQTRAVRPAVIDEHIQNPRLREAVRSWRRDPCFDLYTIGETDSEREFLANYQKAFEEYNELCETAQQLNARKRYFAWRWAYADGMVASEKGV